MDRLVFQVPAAQACPGMAAMMDCLAQSPAALVYPDTVETKDCPVPQIPAAWALPGMAETMDRSARIPVVPAAEEEDTGVVGHTAAARAGSQAVEGAAAQDSGVPTG